MQISISNIIKGERVLNISTNIVSNFKKRVLADGGIFEAQACLETTLIELNNIK